MRRTLLSFFSLLALASLMLATACSAGGTAKAKSTPTPLPTSIAPSKPTYKVQKGDVTSQIQFSARVVPVVQEDLFFRTNGRVRKVYVKSGDQVKKGQVLADLISLDQMESQSKQQQINLRRAQINYEMAWLRQQLAATQTPNWDQGYDIKMKMNQFEVELAQLSLDETKLQAQNLDTSITDAEIIAPIDGKVLSMNVLEGDDVNAFDAKISVGDATQLEVGGVLTSTQLQELAEKTPVTVELPNRPGEKLTGTIRSLPYPYGTGGGKKTTSDSGSAASLAGQGVDNTARVSLDNPDALKTFRMGDLVTVTVVLKSVKGVLWLPPQSIRTFEGRNFVVVKNASGLPTRTDIKVGIQNDERVEVLSGVKEGQEVVAP